MPLVGRLQQLRTAAGAVRRPASAAPDPDRTLLSVDFSSSRPGPCSSSVNPSSSRPLILLVVGRFQQLPTPTVLFVGRPQQLPTLDPCSSPADLSSSRPRSRFLVANSAARNPDCDLRRRIPAARDPDCDVSSADLSSSPPRACENTFRIPCSCTSRCCRTTRLTTSWTSSVKKHSRGWQRRHAIALPHSAVSQHRWRFVLFVNASVVESDLLDEKHSSVSEVPESGRRPAQPISAGNEVHYEKAQRGPPADKTGRAWSASHPRSTEGRHCSGTTGMLTG